MPAVVPLITNSMEHKELHTTAQHGPNPKPNKSSQHLTPYLLKISINIDILFHPCASYLFSPELPTKTFHTFLIFLTHVAIPALTIFQYLTTLIIFTEKKNHDTIFSILPLMFKYYSQHPVQRDCQ